MAQQVEVLAAAAEFNTQDPDGWRREPTPVSCALTAIYTTHAHKEVNVKS